MNVCDVYTQSEYYYNFGFAVFMWIIWIVCHPEHLTLIFVFVRSFFFFQSKRYTKSKIKTYIKLILLHILHMYGTKTYTIVVCHFVHSDDRKMRPQQTNIYSKMGNEKRWNYFRWTEKPSQNTKKKHDFVQCPKAEKFSSHKSRFVNTQKSVSNYF